MGSKIKNLVAAFLSITSKKKFSMASNKYFNQRIFHFLTTAHVHFCGETVNAHECDCTVAFVLVKTSRPQQIPMNVRFTTVYLSVTQGFVSSRPAQFSLVKPYSSWINARMPEQAFFTRELTESSPLFCWWFVWRALRIDSSWPSWIQYQSPRLIKGPLILAFL